VAEQGHHMVPEARHSVFLGARLHGLPLSLSALDDAALALVEIDERAHLQLTPLRLKLGGWVAARSRPCRAQKLEPQCFRLTKGDGRLLLPEQDGGGMGASVVWMGDRGLFQI